MAPIGGKDGDDVTDEVLNAGEAQTNRTNAHSQRKLLDKGKGKDEETQQVSFLPSVSGFVKQDKGKFGDIERIASAN